MRRLVLMGVLCASVAGWAQAVKSPSFEVTVVKPAKPDADGEDWDSNEGTTIIQNYPVVKLIRAAYGLSTVTQVVDAPDWLKDARFDVTAKVDAEEFHRLNSLSADDRDAEFNALLKGMLAERFGLKVQTGTRKMSMYALERVSATSLGPKLGTVPTGKDGRAEGGSHSARNGGHWEAGGVSMERIATLLSARYEMGGRPVVDRTKTPGYFRFTMDYAPDNGTGVNPDATLPGLVDAVREELGLKLVKTEGEVPVVIVEAVKKPELD